MRPLIAITMGDPASIGPELCARAFAEASTYEMCRPLLVGDVGILRRAMAIDGVPRLPLHPIDDVSEASFAFGVMDVLDTNLCSPEDIPVGRVSAKAGDAAFGYVRRAIALAMAGKVDATVTNAICKESMNLAGHSFAGHTEIYAHETGAKRYAMMLVHKDMRIVHVSTHVSLREACDRVTRERVLEVIRLAHQACLDLGIAQPRIGVAGLNPHCGENGLFGQEEIVHILPAVSQARSEGMDVDGPVAPDTVYSKARGGWYDIVVAMYHDQGHIPLKLLGFVFDRNAGAWQAVSGVNITLGLPILRASVDHGTAFDQAGKGTASPASLLNAIRYAATMAGRKPSSRS